MKLERRLIGRITLTLLPILLFVLLVHSSTRGANCTGTSVGYTPLTDLGTGKYRGYSGGLYANGLNQPPPTYLENGLAHAAMIRPLGTEGQPSANGKMVLLSIGMSNTTMEFSAFKRMADPDPQKNPQLIIVDDAQGGQDTEIIKNPNANFWTLVDQRLIQSGVNSKQVQAVWLKEAIAGENKPFPADAQQLQTDLRAIVQILVQRYPAMQLVYPSSRTYAGYATTSLNPEPYAYQSAFAVKWLIEEQSSSQEPGPWLGWGPYLWTDGTRGRSDGFVWTCDDVRSNDGTHPSDSGVQKVDLLLMSFFKSDSTAVNWYLRTPAPASSISLTIAGGGASITATRGTGSKVKAGYAIADPGSSSALYGTAVFSLNQNGVIVSEAGVPASPPITQARIFIDYRTGTTAKSDQNESTAIRVNTGFAVVNRGSAPADLTFLLRTMKGEQLASGLGTLGLNAHRALYISELNQWSSEFVLPQDFGTVTQFGSLEITSDQPLSIVALRLTTNQRGETLITTTPFADLTRPAASGPLYFSQMVDGGGYQFTLILLNNSAVTETGTIQILGSDGTPLAIRRIGDSTAQSEFSYSIPPGSLFRLITDGSPTIAQVGWAQVHPTGSTPSPVGSGVFGFTQNGVLVTELGVPSALPTTHARIYVDRSSGHDTGLAIVNVNNAAQQVTLAAFQPDGVTPVGNVRSLNLTPNGKDARFAEEYISGLPAGFTGVLDMSSSLPFAALTLRSLMNARGNFLLTTFPIAYFNSPALMPIVFPQIVDGGDYRTQFIFVGTAGPVSATLNFLSDEGSPLALGKRE